MVTEWQPLREYAGLNASHYFKLHLIHIHFIWWTLSPPSSLPHSSTSHKSSIRWEVCAAVQRLLVHKCVRLSGCVHFSVLLVRSSGCKHVCKRVCVCTCAREQLCMHLFICVNVSTRVYVCVFPECTRTCLLVCDGKRRRGPKWVCMLVTRTHTHTHTKKATTTSQTRWKQGFCRLWGSSKLLQNNKNIQKRSSSFQPAGPALPHHFV